HTAYLLGDELRRISPNLLKLVDRALKSQITEPFLKENDCWWMGYTGATLNNWSPWIISNILRVFLMYETDANAKKAAIFKSCDVLEKYFSTLPEDGECTEGAAYWDVSVGALFDCIEIMRVASHGKIDLSGNKRLRAALGYIVRSHIDKNFFLNYGDNSFILNVDYNMISRFAETMGDDEAKAFALAQAKYAPDPMDVKEGTRYEYMRRALPAAMRRQTYAEPKAEEFGDVLYARSLLFLARSPRKGGYIVSAKGRRADKGHGHLDAGSFIVYKNGPVVIDVGTETYTAKSFSCERYEIWTRRSEYHNVPVFNGTVQTYYDADLPDRKEQNLFYDGGTKLTGYFPGEASSVEYDLTRAYASSSRLTSYLRKFTLDKNTDTLTIEERATFIGGENRTDFTFMCAERPIVSGKRVKIGAAELSFETEAEYGLKVEEIPVDDDRLRLSWGDRIWRLILGVKSGKELYVKAIFG
ncbi:MAG: heparinase II/III family protein, partial [Candidatus Gallimonas sp.]